MTEYHKDSNFSTQNKHKRYKATDRAIGSYIFEHLGYYEIGIYFVLKQFGSLRYSELEGTSSLGNKNYFKFCVQNLIKHGYIVEVSNG